MNSRTFQADSNSQLNKKMNIFESDNSMQEIILQNDKNEQHQKTIKKKSKQRLFKMNQQLQQLVDDLYDTLLIEKNSFDSQFIKTNKKIRNKKSFKIDHLKLYQIESQIKSQQQATKFQCKICFGCFKSGQSLGGHVSKTHRIQK